MSNSTITSTNDMSHQRKVGLSWRIIAKVMRENTSAFGVAVMATSGGLGDSLALISPNNCQPVLLLNRNSDSANVLGHLVMGVWKKADKNISKVATGLAGYLEVENGIQDRVARENIIKAAEWIANTLADPAFSVDWCWSDGQDGLGNYSDLNRSVLSSAEIPAVWNSLASPISCLSGMQWVWAVVHNGKAVAWINLLANAVIYSTSWPGKSPSSTTTASGAEKDLVLDAKVVEALGKYVYALRDPRNGQVFYVGKGTGDRVLDHKKVADETLEVSTAKIATIKDIQSSGSHVEHLLIRTGIATDDQAFAVEQAVIDAFAAAGLPLTNLVKGHNSDTFGLMSIEAFIQEKSAEPMEATDVPLVMFKIQNKWTPDASEAEIYKATREHWVIGENTRRYAKYAFGVAYGIVRCVYRIDEWVPSDEPGLEKRWMFNGSEAPEMRHLIGTKPEMAFKKYAANPVLTFLNGYPG